MQNTFGTKMRHFRSTRAAKAQWTKGLARRKDIK